MCEEITQNVDFQYRINATAIIVMNLQTKIQYETVISKLGPAMNKEIELTLI